MWAYTGAARPPFAETPGPDQESVWDYPRPPAVVEDRRLVQVFSGEALVARSVRALRVCETASPPTFYLPNDDVSTAMLSSVAGQSVCEWKGAAVYYSLTHSQNHLPVAWSYPNPHPEFAQLRNTFGFFPGRLHCTVDGELVRPQPGHFYAGWITAEVVGPFKGEAGSGHW